MAKSADATRAYTAFISYRHTEPDMQVAKEIHRKLERYHLDRDVREQSGFDSLAPIFRDQDELPISSALDDDLVQALHHASSLIVICSPRLKLSAWCMREIDVFLETHDRSRVFVAVCEGEPHDVIPQQLLHRTGTNGELVDVEPLAANFLPTCKGAERRAEVTRLAAGILGVPYDSLVKRARRRRQRIAGALAAAALAATTAFALYNAYMNAQISANYQQALRRRSEYLATEANALVEQGNTIGATELALAALPADEPPEAANRPVVPGAVYALQQATNAGYAGSLVGQASFTTTEVYGLRADLRQMHVSPNERFAAVVDESEVVSAWEMGGHRLIFQSRSSMGRYEDVVDAFVLDSGNTVVVYETGVVCRDSVDGSVLWDVAVGSVDQPTKGACVDETSQNLLMVASAQEARILDLRTGATLHSVSYGSAQGMPTLAGLNTAILAAPCARDGRFCVLVSLLDDEGMFQGCRALVIDAQDGAARAYEVPGSYAYGCDLLEDGSLVMLLGTVDGEASVSNTSEAFGNTYTTTTDFDVVLACLDTQLGEVRWANTLTIWQVCYAIGFKDLRSAGRATGSIVCWLSDRVLFVDAQTGQIERELKTASSIVGGSPVSDGEAFMGIESDGSFFTVGPANEQVLAQGLMRDDLYYANVRPSGEMYVPKGNVLYAYRGAVYDDGVSTLEVGDQRSSWHFATHEGFVLAYIATDEGVLRVQHCSAPQLDVLWSQDFAAEEGLVWNLVGFDSKADVLLLAGFDVSGETYVARTLVRLDLAAKQAQTWELGTCEELGLAVPASGMTREVTGLVVGNATSYRDGVVYSQVIDAQGRVGIVAASLDAGTTCCYAVEGGLGGQADRGQRSLYLMVDPLGKRLAYQDYAGNQEGDSGLMVHATAVLDLATGVSTRLATDVAGIWHSRLIEGALCGRMVWSNDGQTLACVSAEGVTLYRPDGRKSGFVPLDGRRVAGMTLVGDRLVVLLSLGMTGQLESYSTKTGALLAMYPLDDGNDEAFGWASVPDGLASDGSGNLFVATPSFGYLLDGETLEVCQRYSLGLAYNSSCDALLLGDAGMTSYHALPRYSLEALAGRGRHLLGTQTMGQEWLAAHGA